MLYVWCMYMYTKLICWHTMYTGGTQTLNTPYILAYKQKEGDIRQVEVLYRKTVKCSIQVYDKIYY